MSQQEMRHRVLVYTQLLCAATPCSLFTGANFEHVLFFSILTSTALAKSYNTTVLAFRLREFPKIDRSLQLHYKEADLALDAHFRFFFQQQS